MGPYRLLKNCSGAANCAENAENPLLVLVDTCVAASPSCMTLAMPKSSIFGRIVPSIICAKNVCGLDIAMRDALLVREGDRFDDRREQRDRFEFVVDIFFRETFFEFVFEIAARQPFHREVGERAERARCLPESMHADDGRMLAQSREQTCFFDEFVEKLRGDVLGEVRRDL